MRTRRPVVCLLVAASLAPAAALAQNQDPIGAAMGLANGVLGNSASGSSSSSRSRSRSRSRARTPATPLSAGAPRQALVAAADGYMNLPLETFQATKRVQPPPYNWSSDGCSFGELSGPFRESFNRACDRHDFGYRNYGGTGLALDRTEARRTRVDDRLRDDLNGVCRSQHAGLTETPCLAAAQAIYATARSQGSSWFMTGTGRPMSVPTPAVPGFNTGANQSPIPGVPMPGGSQGGNGLPMPIPGAGGGNNGLPMPIPGAGGGNGLPMPIPGAGGGNGMNPAQVLTVPGQVLNGGR
jgi:hypothetical protein